MSPSVNSNIDSLAPISDDISIGYCTDSWKQQIFNFILNSVMKPLLLQYLVARQSYLSGLIGATHKCESLLSFLVLFKVQKGHTQMLVTHWGVRSDSVKHWKLGKSQNSRYCNHMSHCSGSWMAAITRNHKNGYHFSHIKDKNLQ